MSIAMIWVFKNPRQIQCPVCNTPLIEEINRGYYGDPLDTPSFFFCGSCGTFVCGCCGGYHMAGSESITGGVALERPDPWVLEIDQLKKLCRER